MSRAQPGALAPVRTVGLALDDPDLLVAALEARTADTNPNSNAR